ncbi:MAG: galactose ABC transporter substrate-binding protein [Bacillota bacterium]
MRKLLITGLLIVLGSVTLACEERSSDSIPLVVYDMNDDYMQDFTDKIREEADDDYAIELHDSKNSQTIQNEIIESLIEEDPPLIVVNPVDRLGARIIIQKAKQADIPLVFINREPLQEDLDLYDKAYYIGADPAESADLQAETVVDLFGDDPENLSKYDTNDDDRIQTAVLMGQQGHQDAEIRTKRVIEALENFGYDLDLLDIKVANFNRLEGREAMVELIDVYGDDIELVISNNDAMAVGAVTALENEGLIEDTDENGVIDHADEPWVPVVGIDGLDIARTLIETGHLYATVLNDSAQMAEALVELIDFIETEKPMEDYPFTLEDDTYVWIDYQTFAQEIDENEEPSNSDSGDSEEDDNATNESDDDPDH